MVVIKLIRRVKGSAWRSQRYLQKSRNLSRTSNAMKRYVLGDEHICFVSGTFY